MVETNNAFNGGVCPVPDGTMAADADAASKAGEVVNSLHEAAQNAMPKEMPPEPKPEKKPLHQRLFHHEEKPQTLPQPPVAAPVAEVPQQEPEKETRCRRYLAVAGMYFSFSEELARENDTDAMRKGIEVLEKAAGENMEGQWEAVIWQRLADACYLGGKSGDGEREQDWCQESFLYYERLLCSRQDGNRRKNLLRAAELALQFDMQEKAEQYLNEAAEILGMEEDIFYQQIRKRWEEAG